MATGNNDVLLRLITDDSQAIAAFQRQASGVESLQTELDGLGKAYTEAFSGAAKSSEDVDKIFRDNLKSVEAVENALNDIPVVTKAIQQQNIQLKTQLAGLEAQYRKVGKRGSDEAKAIRVQMDALKASIQQNNIALQQLNFDEKRIKGFRTELAQTGATFKVTLQQAQQLTPQLNDLFVQLASGQSVFTALIQQGPQITQIFGGFRNTVRALSGALLTAFKSTLTLRNGLRLLAATPILLVLSAIIAFVARSEKAVNALEKAFVGLGAGFDVIVDRLAKFGGAIVGFITGQKSFNQAVNEGKAAFAGIRAEISRANQAAQEYFELTKQIERELRNLDLSTAKYQKTLVALQGVADDETKSFKEREAALREIARIELQQAQEREKTLKKERDFLLKKGDITDSNGQLTQKYVDAEKAYQEAAAETLSVELRNQQSSKEIQKQRSDAAKKQLEELKELKKRTQELFDIVAEANARLAGPAAVAELQFDLAIRKIKELEEEAKKLGITLDFSPLAALAEADKRRGLDKASGLLPGLDKLPDFIEKTKKEATSSLEGLQPVFVESLEGQRDFAKEGSKAIAEFATGFNKNVDEIKEDQKRIKLSDEEKQDIENSFKDLLASIFEGEIAITEAQIEQNEKVIDSLQKRRDETQRLLDEELKLKEQGFANDSSLLQKKLEEDNAALAAAEAKKLELERKAARQRLISESAQQVSSLGLAAARLAADGALKGLPGILLAVGAIALLYRTIAQARANAIKLAQPPGFKEGTPYVEGPGTTTSDSVFVRLSKGERVVKASDNQEIGGRQVTNKELVELFQIGKAVKVNPSAVLLSVMEQAQKNPLRTVVPQIVSNKSQITELSQKQNFEMLAKTYREVSTKVIEKQTHELIEAMKNRPVVIPLDDGRTLLKYWNGSTEVTEIIKGKK